MAKALSSVQKAIPVVRTHDLWQSLHDDVDHLFTRHPALRRWFYPGENWSEPMGFSFPVPAVDMTEDDNGYYVTAELPGLEDKDIEVTVSGDLLILKGEKNYEKEEKNKNRHVSERAFGSFRRTLALPGDVDRNEVAAALTKGVLTITLPKTADSWKKQQKIRVKSAA